MRFPDEITYGDKYGPAMKIIDQAEADEYFEACVEHNMRVRDNTRLEAEKIEHGNLGYWSGYYNHETRIRVERLFKCAHPIFGKAEDGAPTPVEACQMGAQLAKNWSTEGGLEHEEA